MGNTLYPSNTSDDQYYANVSECFCAMRASIEECNWDKFVAHARATRVVDVLLNKDHLCRTILHYAAMNTDPRYVEGVLLLIRHLSKCEDPQPYLAPDFHGNTPLHLALGHDNRDGARMLYEAFPDYDYAPNHLGNTILHLAVMRDNVHCAEHLLDKFPEMRTVANKEGKKPSDLASSAEMKGLFAEYGIECHQTIAFIAITPESRIPGAPTSPRGLGVSNSGSNIPVIPVAPTGIATPVSPRGAATRPYLNQFSPSQQRLSYQRTPNGQLLTRERMQSRIPVVPVAGAFNSPRQLTGLASPTRIPVSPPRSAASPTRIPIVPVSPRQLTGPASPTRIPVSPPRSTASPTRIPIVPVSPRQLTGPASPTRIPIVPVASGFSPRPLTGPASPTRIPIVPVASGFSPQPLTLPAVPTPSTIRIPSTPIGGTFPQSPTIIPSPRFQTPLNSLPRIPGTQ